MSETINGKTYAQIRHLICEEIAQGIEDDTFEYDGKIYQSLGANHFAKLVRQMRDNKGE